MRRWIAVMAAVVALATASPTPARGDGFDAATRSACRRGVLCAGAAKVAVSPTASQVAGELETRAFGLGLRRQRFHLGGFGVNPLQGLPDADGSLAAGLTRPAARTRFVGSQGPEDLWVRALVLRTPGGPTVALVTLDATGAGNVVQARLTDAVARATGIPQAAVLFSQTHTHAGPDLQGLWGGVPESWIRDVLVPGAVRAVRAALADVRAVTVEERHGPAPDFNSYRRPKILDPAVDTDSVATLVQARDAGSGALVANLLQFNAHPTTVNEQVRIPHPDFVLGALDLLERRAGGIALYVNGPIADASPSGSRPGCAYPTDGTYGVVRCRGEGIAAAALAFPRGRVLAPTLEVRHATAVLPATNPLFLAAGAVGAFNRYYDFSALPVARIPGLGPALAAGLVDLPQTTAAATTLVTRITVGGPGGLELVTIPGEATGTFVDDIRSFAAPGAHVVPLGLTHDSLGYIIPAEEFSYVDASGDVGFLLPYTSYEELVSLGPLTAPLLRFQAYAPLFGVPLERALPPVLTDCLADPMTTRCALHVMERHLDYAGREVADDLPP